MAKVERLPVLYHSADYISFGIIGPIVVYLKMKFCSCLSTVILSLPLIQEGQLSVSGERMCTILVNRLED